MNQARCHVGRRGRVVRIVAAAIAAGTLFTTCNALVRVPGVRLDASGDGVFIDVLGGHIDVTARQVLVDLPGIDIDVHGGF
ncbi:MAG: hypothetical protein ACE5E6_05235 [Phycisphaerae bacterium]